MRGKLQQLPAAMEDADRKLKAENERLAQLQRLEPVNEKVVKLKAELPGMRQQLDDVTQRLEKLRLEVTEVRYVGPQHRWTCRSAACERLGCVAAAHWSAREVLQ